MHRFANILIGLGVAVGSQSAVYADHTGGTAATTPAPAGASPTAAKWVETKVELERLLAATEREPQIITKGVCGTPNPPEYRYLPGDANCDGRVDNIDIDAFLLALGSPQKHQTIYPVCGLANADIDNDGFVTFFDVDGFTALVSAAPDESMSVRVGVPGDANCDGRVDNFDIDAFIAALSENYATLAEHPCGRNLDIDGDGRLTLFDVEPFGLLLPGAAEMRVRTLAARLAPAHEAELGAELYPQVESEIGATATTKSEYPQSEAALGAEEYPQHEVSEEPSSALESTNIPGDANCDGRVDNFDIDAFIAILIDSVDGHTAACGASNVDADGNGVVSILDAGGFQEILVKSSQ